MQRKPDPQSLTLRPHQVMAEVHERAREAGGAVEPEAPPGQHRPCRHHAPIVDVFEFIVVNTHAELNHHVHQEEDVDKRVEVERGDAVAGVVVVPEADLDGGDAGRVQEEQGVAQHHRLHESRTRIDQPASLSCTTRPSGSQMPKAHSSQPSALASAAAGPGLALR
eukprot:CAMPEP_0172193660 /NCGR_PEP_ID=MMETSP1050-20130122/25096_1 /TAXON_ID=233186 /ORGANISM="Cryptomonas curvata, Strain CCAP979/52" /LENGTH=165 /DNA_ID=CAMNT_0012869277 /DNA_START=144 /DNA_END=637 /DNA_ORIENTATION=+